MKLRVSDGIRYDRMRWFATLIFDWNAMYRIRQHPLVNTLFNLEGNPRASVITEPMWGIPYNLFIPYASIYMLALGVSDVQIGMITSLGLLIQPIFALLSGALTDKFGRRLITLVSDILSWSIPCLIWAVAQDIRFFVVAAVFNAMWRISMNSWTCLLVEDADPDQLVHIWTWIHIAGLMAAFFAPLAGLLIGAINLVPAVRILYLFAFIMMTIKAWILYRYSTETKQGYIRMEETQDSPLLSLLGGLGEVLLQILRTPRTLVVLGIMFVMGVVMMINSTFWSILATEKLGILAEHLAIFPFAKSGLMLILYFLLVPRLNVRRFRNPMILGFTGFLAANLILVTMPAGNYFLLLISVLIEAASLAMFGPLMDALTIISIDDAERARINSILFAVVILLTSPFGWIAGQLSEINRVLPFVLNICLFIIGSVLVWLAWRLRDRDATVTNLEIVTASASE
jgi:MFS family permease